MNSTSTQSVSGGLQIAQQTHHKRCAVCTMKVQPSTQAQQFIHQSIERDAVLDEKSDVIKQV